MTLCNLCEDIITNKSYWLAVNKGMNGCIVEVCPECHHYYTYGTEEQKQKYKERRNIK